MQVADEMRSATKNIRYYVDILRGLNSRQFDIDMGKSTGVLLDEKRVRFSGEIGSSCETMLLCCQNIERQVQIAEGQSKER